MELDWLSQQQSVEMRDDLTRVETAVEMIDTGAYRDKPSLETQFTIKVSNLVFRCLIEENRTRLPMADFQI